MFCSIWPNSKYWTFVETLNNIPKINCVFDFFTRNEHKLLDCSLRIKIYSHFYSKKNKEKNKKAEKKTEKKHKFYDFFSPVSNRCVRFFLLLSFIFSNIFFFPSEYFFQMSDMYGIKTNKRILKDKVNRFEGDKKDHTVSLVVFFCK